MFMVRVQAEWDQTCRISCLLKTSGCVLEKRVLWLPEKLQKAVVASHATTLAFGLKSGGVVIMEFGNEAF